MPDTPHAVSVTFHVKPEAVATMKKIIAEVTEPSLGEDGMTVYRWSQCADDSTRFLLYMEWENRASFDAHMASPHVKHAQARLADGLLAEPYDLCFYNRMRRDPETRG